ncbi:MAG: tRNA (adenosine(37)-N6)-dimethylallyltransferase MiaA [Dehalococcoidia bacterium]
MPPPLIAIVGATSTGKTALGVSLARAVDGEIINADSRQVYRGMDIGTAKPSAEEREAARHWLLDAVAPDEPFTLATFLDLAQTAVGDIRSRGKRPIVAGGTGQYIWALVEGWRVPRVPPDRRLRAELEGLASREGSDALHHLLREEDPASAAEIDPRNVRRVVRAIEVTRATGRPFSAWRTKDARPPDAVVLGLRTDRARLYARIDARVDAMVAAGLVAEVRGLLGAGYARDLPAMSSIGYRQICEHVRGQLTLDEGVARMKTETHRLARMQHTWFRPSDGRIRWLDAEAPDLAAQALAAVEAAGLPAR